MSTQNALTPLDPSDYNAIEAAVMETARGRWFLAEFARRNRHADTEIVLEALARLEQSVAGGQTARQLEKVRADIADMAEAIIRTKREIAALRPDGDSIRHFEEATTALDLVVKQTEKATSDILGAAEQIQEAAWTLRERGADGDQCDIIDHRATDIYTACTFQDLTAQRTRKVVQTLTYLETRINAMMDSWKGATADAMADVLKPPPIFEDEVLTQDAVDVFVDDDTIAFEVTAPDFDEMPAPRGETPPPAPDAAPRAEILPTLPGDLPAQDDMPATARPHAADIAAASDAGEDDPLADLPDDDDADDLVFVERDPVDGQIIATTGVGGEGLAALDALPPSERLRRFT